MPRRKTLETILDRINIWDVRKLRHTTFSFNFFNRTQFYIVEIVMFKRFTSTVDKNLNQDVTNSTHKPQNILIKIFPEFNQANQV